MSSTEKPIHINLSNYNLDEPFIKNGKVIPGVHPKFHTFYGERYVRDYEKPRTACSARRSLTASMKDIEFYRKIQWANPLSLQDQQELSSSEIRKIHKEKADEVSKQAYEREKRLYEKRKECELLQQSMQKMESRVFESDHATSYSERRYTYSAPVSTRQEKLYRKTTRQEVPETMAFSVPKKPKPSTTSRRSEHENTTKQSSAFELRRSYGDKIRELNKLKYFKQMPSQQVTVIPSLSRHEKIQVLERKREKLERNLEQLQRMYPSNIKFDVERKLLELEGEINRLTSNSSRVTRRFF